MSTPNKDTAAVSVNILFIAVPILFLFESNIIPVAVAATREEMEFMKVINDVPIPSSCGCNVACAAGVIDTDLKLSAIPVREIAI